MRVTFVDSVDLLRSLVWPLAREVARLGHEAVLVGAYRPGEAPQLPGVRVVRAPSTAGFRRNLLTHVVDHLALALTATRRTASDAFYVPDSVASAAMALCGAGAKTVWFGHSNVLYYSRFGPVYDPQMHRLMLWSSRFAGPRMGRVAINGPSVAGWWRRLGVSSDRIVVVPNGIDPPDVAERPDSDRNGHHRPGPARLLYVGRLAADKGGADSLIRGIKLVEEGGMRLALDVVGDGAQRGELEGLSARLGIGGRVRFWGVVDRGRLAAFYRDADLVVLPSRSEMMPRVMLEAWSYGRPFLASPVGAIPDYLRDGFNGFLVDDASPEGLADRLRQALADPDRLVRVAREGERTAAGLSWRNTAETMVRSVFEPLQSGAWAR